MTGLLVLGSGQLPDPGRRTRASNKEKAGDGLPTLGDSWAAKDHRFGLRRLFMNLILILM
jgi:hypothetical protein